jgi:hypothetical protein
VTGGTDSTGPAQYNYDLSQRRADAVVQYLAAKYGIAAHRFYLIGIGKDKEVAPNDTAEGRKQNRRVEIQLLTNMSGRSANCASNACAFGIGQLSQRKNGRQRAGHPERFRMALPFWCAKTCYEVAV